MNRILVWISISFLSITANSQNIGATEIIESNVKSWVLDDVLKYHGIYQFGENDGSQLILLMHDSSIIAQVRQPSYWVEGGFYLRQGKAKLSELDIKWEFKTLSNVSIKSGKFYSEQYQGEFVAYFDSTGQHTGLKINNPWNTWIGKDRYEIGLKRIDFEITKWFPGKFPQASLRILTSTELDTLTKDDLKKMRNEIFARYGFAFEKGSEMDIYFRQQAWYSIRYDDVSGFLTTIELANINTIIRLEDKW